MFSNIADNASVTVKRPTRTGTRTDEGTVASSVACLILRQSPYRHAKMGAAMGDDPGLAAPYVGRFPTGTDLRDDDLLYGYSPPNLRPTSKSGRLRVVSVYDFPAALGQPAMLAYLTDTQE